MITIKQLSKNIRKTKNRKRTPALRLSPQKKGVCRKVYMVSPKKPNSAVRKVAKIKLSNGIHVICYIPGIGHNLQMHSAVLIRGGRTQDLPGVKYKIIRGKFDSEGVSNRKTARSKYGKKKKQI
jgi:small subunit ribosomal protein S12